MASRSMSFFAVPNEQGEWLARVLEQDGVWCLAEREGARVLMPLGVADAKHVGLKGREYAVRFFLGRKDLGEPVIREVLGGMELMMVPSLAVQVAPSMLVGEVLTEGTIAIMRKHQYEEAGVDDHQLHRWFQTLVGELREALLPPRVVLYTTGGDDPDAEARGKHVVSASALERHRRGVKFKQFVQSRIELVAREAGPVAEPNP